VNSKSTIVSAAFRRRRGDRKIGEI